MIAFDLVTGAGFELEPSGEILSEFATGGRVEGPLFFRDFEDWLRGWI